MRMELLWALRGSPIEAQDNASFAAAASTSLEKKFAKSGIQTCLVALLISDTRSHWGFPGKQLNVIFAA